MRIGNTRIPVPIAISVVLGGMCMVCCVGSLVVSSFADATRSPADKTATVAAKNLAPESTRVARESLTAAAPTSAPRATATPVPPPTVADITGTFLPKTLRIGQTLTLSFEVKNAGTIPIDGVHISVDGPYDKYTHLGCVPTCVYEQGGFLTPRQFQFASTIAPGQTLKLTVTGSPNEPGNQELNFRFRTKSNQEIKDSKGATNAMGGTVNVTR